MSATQQNPTASAALYSLEIDETGKPPPTLIIHGEPGIGKTTFGTQAPGCVLVATEDGAAAVRVPKLPANRKAEAWEELFGAVEYLLTSDHDRKWLVLDTLNGAAKLCSEYVCKKSFDGLWESTKGQEGYSAWGRGAKETARELQRLLNMLDRLKTEKAMGLILLSHTAPVRTSNMFGSDFQESAPNLERPVLEAVKAWADQIAYAGRDIRASVREGEKTAKISMVGDTRWLWFEGQAGCVAKNRVGYEMPSKIQLDWSTYEAELNKDHTGQLVDQVLELLKTAAADVVAVIEGKLRGGIINNESLADLGTNKLESLIGWLIQKAG